MVVLKRDKCLLGCSIQCTEVLNKISSPGLPTYYGILLVDFQTKHLYSFTYTLIIY